jgi:tetratricopeptide (TPR) repeat protein
MDSIWPESDVEPNNLSQNVTKLRRLLGEKPGQNRFIETVAGRGYRFIADVQCERTLPGRTQGIRAAHNDNDDASRLLRQALRLLQRPTAENCRLAIEHLESALQLDSRFAPAWAWLADAHLLTVNVGNASPERLSEAERQALRALELEPHVPAAHAVIGTIRCHRGDWIGAEAHFMMGLAIDGTDSMCRTLHATFLLQQVGHCRRALAQLREAYVQAPDDPRMLMNLAMAHCNCGRDDEALRCARLAIGFGYPEDAAPLPFVFANAAARQGRYAEAAGRATSLLTATVGGQLVVECVYSALAQPQLRETAVRRICELLDGALESLARISGLAVLFSQWLTQLGRVDLAFDAANRFLDACAREQIRPPNWQALWMPELSPFRSDGRFAALAGRLGFPQYWQTFGMPDS